MSGRSALLAATWGVALALSCTACGSSKRPVDANAVRRDGEGALRAYENGLLEVKSFAAEKLTLVRMRDEFWHETWLCLLEFRADVQLRRALYVSTVSELEARLTRTGITTADFEREARRQRVLGEGAQAPGRVRTLGGTVVFEQVGPGCRLHGIDERLDLGDASDRWELAL